MIDLRTRRGRREDHALAPAMRMRQQRVRLWERPDRLQKLCLEDRPMRIAEVLLLGLIRIAQQRRHEHVGTFADLVMDHLPVERLTDAREGFLPGEHVHVVGVRQRAVDIEEDRFDLHDGIPNSTDAPGPVRTVSFETMR